MRAALALAVALALATAACEREERAFRSDPAESDALNAAPVSPHGATGAEPIVMRRKGYRFEENAYHLSQGKRLFAWFNCVGCHANGGGGMGPAFLDPKWKYGGSLAAIAATIREGRPEGMPAFGDKMPAEQIWQIAAYVRSIGRNSTTGAEPGRDDHLHPRPAENRTPALASSPHIPPVSAQP
jgi:cytochrome c oxidase cbb3-type subunit III